jgi:DNA-binding transcriptional LysR family regulator
MDLKDLRFFVAVYEAKSFSGASKRLCTVQSNVSARILAFESALGVSLFERQWRRLVPTAQAEQLYIEAKDLIAAVERVARVFESEAASAA